MAIADVTVRGAGIFGLSVAWACTRLGARVQVIDPAPPGSGASGGIVGALAPHVPDQWNAKKEFQFQALRVSGAYWAEVQAASGLPTGYIRSGRIQPIAETAVPLARARSVGAAEHWGGDYEWLVETGRWGWQIRDTLSAILHPRQAIASLQAALTETGTSFLATGRDEGAVVHATGWRGLVQLDWGQGEKGQAILLGHDLGGTPQLMIDGLHVIPHQNGTVAIGSTSERTWQSEAPDQQCEALLARAVSAMPELTGATVLERWAGVRPRAKTRAPLIGQLPERPNHFIANGGFKIGFGIAPRVGEVLARLILTGEDLIPDEFKPTGVSASS